MDRGAWWATVHGVTELDMTEQLSTAQCSLQYRADYLETSPTPDEKSSRYSVLMC